MLRFRNKEFTYKIHSDKESKNLAILELIRKKGPISRTDISKIARINIVSVSNYVNSFIKKELVLEGGLDISSGGRRPELLELNKKAGFVMGISVKGGFIRAALTDLGANEVSKKEKQIEGNNAEEIQKGILCLIEELANKAEKREAIMAIGLGFSGALGGVRDEISYDRERFLNIAMAVENKFKIKTFFGEDFACAAFAEKNLNLKLSADKFLFFYSDLGAGVYVDGEHFYTPEEPSGEEGPPEPASYHYLKPWKANLGILYRARHAVEKGMGTKIVEASRGEARMVSIDTVIEAANKKDMLARDLIEGAALTLGVRAAYLINLFSPEIVVVGGGIEKAGDLFLRPLRESVAKLVHKKFEGTLKIFPAVYGESQEMLGAAGFAVREVFIEA